MENNGVRGCMIVNVGQWWWGEGGTGRCGPKERSGAIIREDLWLKRLGRDSAKDITDWRTAIR